MWLLVDEHGMNKYPTSTWRDTQEGKLIKDKIMSFNDLKEVTTTEPQFSLL